MSPDHRTAIALTLALLPLLTLCQRVPRPAAPLQLCDRPIGLKRGSRTTILCLEGASLSFGDAVTRLGGGRCAGQQVELGPSVTSGELVSLTDHCLLRREQLPALTRLTLGLPLDLNRASPIELEALPRVGPVLARRIAEARRERGGFSSIEELRFVRGIGPATLRQLRPLLTTSPLAR